MEYESLADGRWSAFSLSVADKRLVNWKQRNNKVQKFHLEEVGPTCAQSDFGEELSIQSCLGPPRGPGQHCLQFRNVGLNDLFWTGTEKWLKRRKEERKECFFFFCSIKGSLQQCPTHLLRAASFAHYSPTLLLTLESFSQLSNVNSVPTEVGTANVLIWSMLNLKHCIQIQ